MWTIQTRKMALVKRLFSGIFIIIFCSGIAYGGSTGPRILKVKGLYLDMRLQDAKDVISKFTDMTHYRLKPFNLTQYKFREFQRDSHKYWFSDARESVLSPIAFATDSQEMVTFISINGALVDKIFNSSRHTAQQFVQQFADTNDLPPMTSFVAGPKSPLPNMLPNTGWTFSSPHGYKITIFSNKDIDIEKTAKSSF